MSASARWVLAMGLAVLFVTGMVAEVIDSPLVAYLGLGYFILCFIAGWYLIGWRRAPYLVVNTLRDLVIRTTR